REGGRAWAERPWADGGAAPFTRGPPPIEWNPIRASHHVAGHVDELPADLGGDPLGLGDLVDNGHHRLTQRGDVAQPVEVSQRSAWCWLRRADDDVGAAQDRTADSEPVSPALRALDAG